MTTNATLMRAIRTLLPGLTVARYSERWSSQSPAVRAFDILAEASGYEPYSGAEQDARDEHVTTEYARSRGMVTVAEMEAAVAAEQIKTEAALANYRRVLAERNACWEASRIRPAQAHPIHTDDCESWGCAHCTVCGVGVLYGSRCPDHPTPGSSGAQPPRFRPEAKEGDRG